MEMLGNDPSTVYGTVHRLGLFKQQTLHAGIDLSAGFHTFGVDWEYDHLTWYLDGQSFGTITDPALIPTVAMYPILDLAVGGSWAGAPDATTPFPSTMSVDYVRIWQKNFALTPPSLISAVSRMNQGAAGTEPLWRAKNKGGLVSFRSSNISHRSDCY